MKQITLTPEIREIMVNAWETPSNVLPESQMHNKVNAEITHLTSYRFTRQSLRKAFKAIDNVTGLTNYATYRNRSKGSRGEVDFIVETEAEVLNAGSGTLTWA